ncbi:MAG: SET domain-containing protein-lysine N-methyltransferase [Burkholderiales bacterium]
MRSSRRRGGGTSEAIALKNAGRRGKGVFAQRRFRAGDVIERAPVLVLSDADWKRVRKTRLFDYAFCWGEDGELAAIAMGLGSYYNHDEAPNARSLEKPDEGVLEFIALRDIAPGEEIVIDYTGAYEDARVWFDVLP